MKDSTRVFGKKTKEDWIKIRDKILENPSQVGNWKNATELLDERLETRYFRPIDRILKMRVSSGEGFAVMTLICSLIEFLHSCYEGKMFDVEICMTNPNFYFGLGKSREKFKKFLISHQPFKSKFSETFKNSKNEDEMFADDFYSNVRCGLLHEAATKNGWTIRTPSKNSTPSSFIDLSNLDEKIIYRDVFYSELKKYCKQYKQKIIDDVNENNFNLRDNLGRKLDSLCEADNPNIKWWKIADETK